MAKVFSHDFGMNKVEGATKTCGGDTKIDPLAPIKVEKNNGLLETLDNGKTEFLDRCKVEMNSEEPSESEGSLDKSVISNSDSRQQNSNIPGMVQSSQRNMEAAENGQILRNWKTDSMDNEGSLDGCKVTLSIKSEIDHYAYEPTQDLSSVNNNEDNNSNLVDESNDDENTENAELSDLEITFESKSSTEYEVPIKRTESNENVDRSRARPFSCDLCSKTFLRRCHLNEHRKTHNIDSEDMTCNLCGNVYKSIRALRRHKKIHQGLEFVCKHPGCYKAFVEKSILDIHSRSHTGVRPYICNICGNSYIVKSHLTAHMMSHSQNKFVCETCGKEFSVKTSYIRHGRVHSDERPFICQLCGKGFSSNKTLEIHLTVHKGEKPYQCDICYKSLRSLSSLKFHRNLHYGSKDFACEHCSKSFTTRKYLMTHLKSHSRLLDFPCKLCKIIFQNHNELQEHIKNMHGSKKVTLECSKCGKFFPTKSRLIRHMKTHKIREQNSDNDYSMAGSENLNNSNDYSMNDEDSNKMSTDDAKSVDLNDSVDINGETNDSNSVEMNFEDHVNENSDNDIVNNDEAHPSYENVKLNVNESENDYSEVDDGPFILSVNESENDYSENDDGSVTFTANDSKNDYLEVDDGPFVLSVNDSENDYSEDDDGPVTFTVNDSKNDDSDNDSDSKNDSDSVNEESSNGSDQKVFWKQTDTKLNVNLFSSFNLSSHFKFSATKKI